LKNKDDPDYMTKEQKAIESWQDLGNSPHRKRGPSKSHAEFFGGFTKDEGSPISDSYRRKLEKRQVTLDFPKRTSTDSENSHEIVTKKSPTSRAKPSLAAKANKDSLLPPLPKKNMKFNQIVAISISENFNPDTSNKNLQVPQKHKPGPKKPNPNQGHNSACQLDTENAPLDPADLKETGRMLLSPKNENIFAEDSLQKSRSPNLASIQNVSQFDAEQASPS
jgi:hypothetical protein